MTMMLLLLCFMHWTAADPPLDSVLVQTRFGPRRRPVLTGNVPAAFADLPQYRDGTWSWIGDEPT